MTSAGCMHDKLWARQDIGHAKRGGAWDSTSQAPRLCVFNVSVSLVPA